MSYKIKNGIKIVSLIIVFPLVMELLCFLGEFLMQIGRIFGTIIRIIMSF